MRNAGFQFNERDAEIINYVHRLRLATLDLLAELTNRSYKTLERRLPRLRDEKYLRRLRPRPQKGLYVIGSQGVEALVQCGYAPGDFADKRLRQSEWKDLTIPHALFVATIQTKLLVQTRSSPIRIFEWRHDHPDLWDSVVVTPQDAKLPVRPDALFILTGIDGPTANADLTYFLEADVGTMSHNRIRLKIQAYMAYHQQQRHIAKYGISSFHVAIVTQTPIRAANLRAELYPRMSAAQRRAYRILSIDELTVAALM